MQRAPCFHGAQFDKEDIQVNKELELWSKQTGDMFGREDKQPAIRTIWENELQGRNYNSKRPKTGKSLPFQKAQKASLSGQKAEYYERREAENQLSQLRSLDFTLSTVGSYKSSKQGNDIEFTKNYFSCYVKNGLYRLNMEFKMLVPRQKLQHLLVLRCVKLLIKIHFPFSNQGKKFFQYVRSQAPRVNMSRHFVFFPCHRKSEAQFSKPIPINMISYFKDIFKAIYSKFNSPENST